MFHVSPEGKEKGGRGKKKAEYRARDLSKRCRMWKRGPSSSERKEKEKAFAPRFLRRKEEGKRRATISGRRQEPRKEDGMCYHQNRIKKKKAGMAVCERVTRERRERKAILSPLGKRWRKNCVDPTSNWKKGGGGAKKRNGGIRILLRGSLRKGKKGLSETQEGGKKTRTLFRNGEGKEGVELNMPCGSKGTQQHG